MEDGIVKQNPCNFAVTFRWLFNGDIQKTQTILVDVKIELGNNQHIAAQTAFFRV